MLAWTDASDSSAAVNPVIRHRAGNTHTSSTKPSVQSKSSSGLRDTWQPTTQGQSVHLPNLLPSYYLGTTPHHTTTSVLRPYFRDHLGEPVLEEDFWTLWCKGRLTEADTLTIRLGATPAGLTCTHLHHPPIFTGRMPFLPPNQQCQSTVGSYYLGSQMLIGYLNFLHCTVVCIHDCVFQWARVTRNTPKFADFEKEITV